MANIYKTKAWEFEFRLTHRKASNAKEIPLTGQTVRGWLSASDGGAPFVSADVLTCAERSEHPGVYYAVLAQTAVATELNSVAEGTIIYEVCERNGEIDSRPLTVVDVSPMQPPR